MTDSNGSAGMSAHDAAQAANLLYGSDALEHVRALAELMFRKGLITPADLDEVLDARARRRLSHEQMWSALTSEGGGPPQTPLNRTNTP